MIAKFFWLGVILVVVWTVFRVIEMRNSKLGQSRRHGQNGDSSKPNKRKSGPKKAGGNDVGEDLLDLRECDECGEFVTGAGCSRAACRVRG